MKCKKHPIDPSSSAGVCASCLRERLAVIIAAQVEAQREALFQQGQQGSRKSDAQLPQFVFPRSVPHVSHRKSDFVATWKIQGHQRRFYTTPQVGPNGFLAAGLGKERKSSMGRFTSVLHGFFRSKSEKTGPDTAPVAARSDVSVDSIADSPSWFSMIVPGRRKKQDQAFYVEEFPIEARSKAGRISDRGMSPSNVEEDEHCRDVSSGYSSESSHGWKQTPWRTPAARRCKGMTAAAHSRNASGLAFCLSPLVRPSLNRRTQKAAPAEMTVAGEAKAQLSVAPSYCRNRSRKLADFGKQSYNPYPIL